MPVVVTPIYAGLLALIYFLLSARVISRRRELWISLGDKGDRQLLRRTRVHGNFAEYVPLSLILMITAELMLTPHWALHAIGIALVAGRVSHAWGVGQEPDNLTLRTIGMILTFAVLVIGGLLNIALAILMSDFAG
ncbi:MAPEG family protein [Roseibium sp.]|uniref:MAPEG family protein n=1 Tax=Roseibium sp. TaxID=1936156 RepID=UPI003A97B383